MDGHTQLGVSPPRAGKRRKRRFLSLSLRSLMLLMLGSATLVALYVEPIQRQRRAAAVVRAHDGRVELARVGSLAGPRWFRRFVVDLLGKEYLEVPVAIYFGPTAFGDEEMKHVSKMPHLVRLNLINTQITNDGLQHIAGHPQLQELLLCGTSIDDTGLDQLEGCNKLRELYLNHTQVTDQGVRQLRPTLPRCKILY